MDNVRDEMANDSVCGKRKRVESASLSRCGLRSVRFLEVKICCKHALVPRIVSAVRSLEWPLLGGCQCTTSMGFLIRD